MIQKIKLKLIPFFSMLLSFMLLITLSALPVSAEGNKVELTPAKKVEIEKELGIIDDEPEEGDPYETGIGVHADPAVFEKNFILSIDQKEYTIKEMKKVVSEIIRPEMSDLEKYYTLAKWVNKHVEYDWEFWSGRYNFEYYSHQWDSYGGMKEDERSVCAGIAMFYADMCHAADLPCKFLRVQPSFLDHTINYIPDINGHAYLVDVTENIFLMSENSDDAFHNLDKAFSHITKPANDGSFDYQESPDGRVSSSTIKDYYDVPFADWYKEYALHESKDKIFKTPYEEKGSGKTGIHYASYHDYDSNRTEHPDIWFIDDFYKNPTDISAKILDGQFDEQITNVVGIKGSYDCDTEQELEEMIEQDMTVKYFPSKEGNTIVPETAILEKGTDYNLILDSFSRENHTAQFTIEGIGNYKGTQTFNVKLYSAIVEKAPVQKNVLVYDGTPQELIEPGQASSGEMQYAIGTENEPVGDFSSDIPTATDVGKYYIWYKAVGDEAHGSSDPKVLEFPAIIQKITPQIIHDDIEIKVGETATLNPVLDYDIPANFNYFAVDEDILKLDGNTITGLKEGETFVAIDASLKSEHPNYNNPEWLYLSVNVVSGTPKKTSIANAPVVLSKTKFTYNGKIQKPSIRTINGMTLKAGTDYTINYPSSKNAGTYTVKIQGVGAYTGSTKATYRINKAKNPMTVKAKTVSVKKKVLKKKPITIKKSKVLTTKKAKGSCLYKILSVKKGKKDFSKKFKINTKTGNILIKKGLGKGSYQVTVKVRAKGNTNYQSSSWKKASFKIKIK